MNYGNIPEEVLKITIAHDLIDKSGDWTSLTLKDELDMVGEDIIFADWQVDDGKIIHLTAWTSNCVLTLLDDYFSLGDKWLMVLQRNPTNVSKT